MSYRFPSSGCKKIKNRQTLSWNRFSSLSHRTMYFVSYPIEVDDHSPVAHLGGLVVGVPDCGERHLCASRAHRDPERCARGVRGRVGVAHHEALSLQDDWFRLVLSADRTRRKPHGT